MDADLGVNVTLDGMLGIDSLLLKGKNVANVTFRSDVMEAKGSIDGAPAKPLPLTTKLLPGPHHVVVEAPNHDTVDVNPYETAEVLIKFTGFRGRYMGMLSVAWALGLLAGPPLGTLVFERNPAALWSACLLLGVISSTTLFLQSRRIAK